jgi:hypothetical protein
MGEEPLVLNYASVNAFDYLKYEDSNIKTIIFQLL